MVIQNILDELKSSEKPVAKPIHKFEGGKALCIGFSQGMELKEHKANKPTTLVVIKGSITYKEGSKQYTLGLFDEYAIPVDVTHAVEATEDSLILLIQG